MGEDFRMNREELSWLKDKTVIEENIEKANKLGDIANELGISTPQLALAWCLKNENVSTVILGASKTYQLEENLKATEHKVLLTSEVLEKIEKLEDISEETYHNIVDSVMKIADKQNHHPDMTVHYDNVKLSITDHDKGKVSDKCHKFVNEVNKIK